MEDKEIIVQINLFTMDSKIILRDGEVIKHLHDTRLNNLATDAIEDCLTYETNQLHLYGNHEYVEALAQEIILQENIKYGIKNLEIKVN